MTVAMPSTPASYFHLLRRQAYARPRRPAGGVHAQVDAAAQGGHLRRGGLHLRRLPSRDRRAAPTPPRGVDRVLLCTGKVYYDLLADRASRATAHRDRAPSSSTRSPATSWARRSRRSGRRARVGAGGAGEPGRLAVVALNLPDVLGRPVRRVSRQASASPATGSTKKHAEEQRRWSSRPSPGDRTADMYFTDRGIEELENRRGDEEVTLAWVATRLREFVDLHPGVRDAGRAAGHVAGPAGRRRRGVMPAQRAAPQESSPGGGSASWATTWSPASVTRRRWGGVGRVTNRTGPSAGDAVFALGVPGESTGGLLHRWQTRPAGGGPPGPTTGSCWASARPTSARTSRWPAAGSTSPTCWTRR